MSRKITSPVSLTLPVFIISLLAYPVVAQETQAGNKGDRAVAVTTLPNGATSVTETYNDWTVSCAMEGSRKTCTLSQMQGDKETGQRVFSIELNAPQGARFDGALIMPFGLKLDDGVKLKIDDQGEEVSLRYSTCYPQGCIAPASFSEEFVRALRKGAALKMAATHLTTGQPVKLSASLTGFSSALDRAIALQK